VLGDHLVGRQQVEQEAQAGAVDAERAPEGLDVARAVLDQPVDEAELEGALQRARVDQRLEEAVDDQEFQVLQIAVSALRQSGRLREPRLSRPGPRS